jgi:hypothetical protein
MTKPDSSNKTCAACGLVKPLTAFLQINGPQGTTYGNICATCRGSSHGKQVTIPQPELDEDGGSASGLKINAKTKVQMATDQKQQTQRLKDLAQKETKKREGATNEKDIFTDLKVEAEKKHREEYIDTKKQKSFLDYKRQNVSAKDPSRQPALDKPALTELQRQQHDVFAKEEKSKTVNLADAYIDPTQAGQTKFNTSEFQNFLTKLGSGAAIRTYERQFLANKSAGNQPATEKSTATNEKDPLVKYINENWDANSPKPPSGSRRR